MSMAKFNAEEVSALQAGGNEVSSQLIRATLLSSPFYVFVDSDYDRSMLIMIFIESKTNLL